MCNLVSYAHAFYEARDTSAISQAGAAAPVRPAAVGSLCAALECAKRPSGPRLAGHKDARLESVQDGLATAPDLLSHSALG